MVLTAHSAPQAHAPGSLNELGLKHGTDKASSLHNYLEQYQRLLTPIYSSVKTLVEIGAKTGASLRMWKDFFPDAQIVGIDINPRCKTLEEDRITIEVGSQADVAFLTSVKGKYQPEVIVDDGSHVWGHQIVSFAELYPALKPGGIYIIEDLHTSRINMKEKWGVAGKDRTAISYFAELASYVGADGTPADMDKSDFNQAIHDMTETVTFGSRYCVFHKKS